MRLEVACDRRLADCARHDQQPLLEAAASHVLLQAGLREHELVALDMRDYQDQDERPCDAKSKGARVSR